MATPKGIDIRQSGSRVLFRVSLKDSAGTKITSGTTSLRLYEWQDDGTLKTYDWSSNTFKSTTVTTETQALTHRTANNGATNTGLWSYALATISGFTRGGVYVAQVTNSGASPESQEREFQYGEAEGDFTVDANGKALLQATQTGVTIPTVTTVTNYTEPLDSTATQAAAAAALSAYDPLTRTEATADKAEVLTAVNGLPTAAEIDTELSGTHGAGDWGPGGSSGEFVRTFTVRDSSTLQGIRNALVTLRASDQVTRVDQKATSASGVAAFNLDTGTYYYQVSATGYQAVTLTELTVAADGSTVVPLTALPSTDVVAGTRTARYILVTPDGATPEGVVVSAKLRAATRASIPLALVQRQTLTTTTDANGVADLVCITADQFAEGDGEYVFSASGVPDITTAIPPGSGALNVQTHTAA